jgi:hypothetical protein
MKKNQPSRIIFTIIFFLFCADSFAQKNDSTFAEESLPDKSVTVSERGEKSNPKQELLNSSLTNQISNDNIIANILLSKKATSLMFDDEENDHIGRAINSLRSNEIYVPDGGEVGDDDKNLTPEERKKKAEEDKKREEENEASEKSYIYLASIIYFTPKDWAVWINKQKITYESNQRDKELYVKSIQKDRVKVVWKISLSKWKILSNSKPESEAPKVNAKNQIEVEFELKQNQTFMLNTHSVVEGKAAVALMRKREDDRRVKAAAVLKGESSGLKTRLSPR